MQAVVIGLGAAGLSTVRHLLRRGAQVKVSDRRASAQIEPETLAFLAQAGVALETGGHSSAFLAGADLVVPGPGVQIGRAHV